MAKQPSITLAQFQKKFLTEEACYDYLYQMKWQEGYRCPDCQYDACYVITTRNKPLYECKKCHEQTTLTVGTIFEKTRTALTIWFNAIFLIAYDKRGVSATLLAKELEISYQTAWTMMHKIRKAMADREAQYMLSGLVEIDDFYIGAPTENGKRGRGTDKNQVLVALSKNNRGNPLFVKMEVIDNMKKETVEAFVTENVQAKSTLQSDGHRTFPTLKDNYNIEAKKFDAKENPEHLKWIHTIISNLKSFVSGTYHGLDSRHLQRYLDEFSFRFNRRKFTGELFNRLLQSCLFTQTTTYSELIG